MLLLYAWADRRLLKHKLARRCGLGRALLTKTTVLSLAGLALCLSGSGDAVAQSVSDRVVLKGLSPVASLSRTEAGRAALSANFSITGGLQSGTIAQPALSSVEGQRQQALQDAAITYGNAAQLADGLGTTLGAAYLARAHYLDRTRFTSATQSVADVLAFALRTSGAHSNAGKFLFANATTDGQQPVPAEIKSILEETGGATDPFGQAYHVRAGSLGAGRYGGARPFQTEPELRRITGKDYFNLPADNVSYTRGPVMDLTDSPSYPSGHTTYGYTGALLLGLLVPERYPQMIVRGAEYGNSRILMGAHYAMDVLGGRTLALYDMAHLLANDPAYIGRGSRSVNSMPDFRVALSKARQDLSRVMEAACGKAVTACAVEDTSRFSDTAANEAFYVSTQTYSLPVVHPDTAHLLEDVSALAPEAGYLLTFAFPSLTLKQADDLLTETEGPGGGFLDDGSSFGLYSRLDLYHAVLLASRREAGRTSP